MRLYVIESDNEGNVTREEDKSLKKINNF